MCTAAELWFCAMGTLVGGLGVSRNGGVWGLPRSVVPSRCIGVLGAQQVWLGSSLTVVG